MTVGEPQAVPPEQHAHELAELRNCCAEFGELFRAEGDEWYASRFEDMARKALDLHDHGFDRASLNALGANFPTPDWLMPKSLDYNAHWEAWQARAASLHQRARSLVLDLRTVARIHEP